MRYAEFQSLGLFTSKMVWSEDMERHTDMVRVSEYIEITFPPRPTEEIVPAQVAVIDKKIAEVSREFGEKLAALKEAKDNLLAITDQRQPEFVE